MQVNTIQSLPTYIVQRRRVLFFWKSHEKEKKKMHVSVSNLYYHHNNHLGASQDDSCSPLWNQSSMHGLLFLLLLFFSPLQRAVCVFRIWAEKNDTRYLHNGCLWGFNGGKCTDTTCEMSLKAPCYLYTFPLPPVGLFLSAVRAVRKSTLIFGRHMHSYICRVSLWAGVR